MAIWEKSNRYPGSCCFSMPFRLRHVCLALPLPLVTSGWLECQAEFGEAPGKGRKVQI